MVQLPNPHCPQIILSGPVLLLLLQSQRFSNESEEQEEKGKCDWTPKLGKGFLYFVFSQVDLNSLSGPIDC